MLHAYFGTRCTMYSKVFLLSIELVLKPRVSTAYYALQISARRRIFRAVRDFVGMPTMFIDLFVFFSVPLTCVSGTEPYVALHLSYTCVRPISFISLSILCPFIFIELLRSRAAAAP